MTPEAILEWIFYAGSSRILHCNRRPGNLHFTRPIPTPLPDKKIERNEEVQYVAPFNHTLYLIL
jgi:hypothetical protein